MAWIETIPEDEASGEVEEAYAAIAAARGKLSNIMRVQSLNPAVMQAHLALYEALLFGRSGLRRAEREAIAVVVSAVNDCAYCVRHHAEALNAYWKDEARVEALTEDHRRADVPERLRALLDYAAKLTRAPQDVAEADVETLRAAGCSDADVLDVNLIASYFNFVNRIAEGLGVTFTPDEAAGYEY